MSLGSVFRLSCTPFLVASLCTSVRQRTSIESTPSSVPFICFGRSLSSRVPVLDCLPYACVGGLLFRPRVGGFPCSSLAVGLFSKSCLASCRGVCRLVMLVVWLVFPWVPLPAPIDLFTCVCLALGWRSSALFRRLSGASMGLLCTVWLA